MAERLALSALLILLILPPTNVLVSATAPRADLEEQAWTVLHGGLTDRNESRRRSAVEALSLLTGDQRAARFAAHALKDRGERVRVAAAVALGELHARAEVPELKNALSDPRTAVVLAAAHSLLMLKDPAAYGVYYAVLMGDRKDEGLLQAQIRRLRDPKQMAQIGFHEGLGFVPYGGMGYEAWREIRRNNTAPLRATAARFLASDPDAISEDALIQTAIVDKSPLVRVASIDALSERGDRACVARLVRNLSDSNRAVRYRTAALILHLRNPSPATSTK
ncbi:MAG: HEAT repeat domain-containing protein [Acidobacteria bacterium]|nr:HEAT repeat domain-containing protein [Acidobacteriota bacterium]